MGLFRLLFRGFFRSSRRKLVEIRRETTVLEDGSPWRRWVAVGQSADKRIVEVTELRGRAGVIDGDTLYIGDRTSTRRNSSHVKISYAVFRAGEKMQRGVSARAG